LARAILADGFSVDMLLPKHSTVKPRHAGLDTGPGRRQPQPGWLPSPQSGQSLAGSNLLFLRHKLSFGATCIDSPASFAIFAFVFHLKQFNRNPPIYGQRKIRLRVR
jgi:hypothetical protein